MLAVKIEQSAAKTVFERQNTPVARVFVEACACRAVGEYYNIRSDPQSTRVLIALINMTNETNDWAPFDPSPFDAPPPTVDAEYVWSLFEHTARQVTDSIDVNSVMTTNATTDACWHRLRRFLPRHCLDFFVARGGWTDETAAEIVAIASSK